MLEPTVGLVSVAVLSSLMVAYYRTDTAKLRSDFQALQFRLGVFSSKVAVLEQYATDIYKEAPEDILVRLDELKNIKIELNSELTVVEKLLKLKSNLEAEKIITARLLDNQWEKRGHRLILSLCKDLTLEASLAKKRGVVKESAYKKKPTLLSLKEIADLLREEKSVRL
jgi:hypothetical protein